MSIINNYDMQMILDGSKKEMKALFFLLKLSKNQKLTNNLAKTHLIFC